MFDVINFYNKASFFYESMVNFELSLKNKKNILKNFIPTHASSAIDLGCGTGIDTLALSSFNLKVVGFDPSEGMLNVAKEHAKSLQSDVEFVNCLAHEIPSQYADSADFLTSLGNTMANIPPEQIAESIKAAYDLLKNKGVLLIQVLNYTKVLADRERIVNITANDKYHYVRFYDFKENSLIFNILSYDSASLQDFELISTEIFPYNHKEFVEILGMIGFNNIELFGGFDKSPFDPETSKDLVILAGK